MCLTFVKTMQSYKKIAHTQYVGAKIYAEFLFYAECFSGTKFRTRMTQKVYKSIKIQPAVTGH